MATIKRQVRDAPGQDGPHAAMAHSDALMVESLRGADVTEGVARNGGLLVCGLLFLCSQIRFDCFDRCGLLDRQFAETTYTTCFDCRLLMPETLTSFWKATTWC